MMKKVYIAAPITKNDPEFKEGLTKIIDSLIVKGIDVLDEHVKGGDLEEVLQIIYRKTGVRRDKSPNPHKVTFEQDMKWLSEATHLVAFIDNPSHGVGMEIMYTILRPKMGQKEVPILLLVHKDNLEKVSSLLIGAVSTDYPNLKLELYLDIIEAGKIIRNFLA